MLLLKKLNKREKNLKKKHKDNIDRAKALGEFEKDIRNNRKNMDDYLNEHMNDKDRRNILDIMENANEWLDSHQNAKASEINDEHNKTKEKLDPIINKAKARKDLNDLCQGTKTRLNDSNDPLSQLSSQDRKKNSRCSR